jgi:hypothetical protein
MPIVLAFIALGAVLGGVLARRFPVDRVGALCSLIAIAGSFGLAVKAAPNSWQAWSTMVLAVVLISHLLICGIRYWRMPRAV